MGVSERRNDWLLYGIGGAILLAIGGTWYGAKRLIAWSEGRDVQALLEKSNLDSDESYRRQAKNYVAELGRRRALTAAQKKSLEEIYAVAFRDWMQIWMKGRMAGESEQETRAKQYEAWQRNTKPAGEILAQ